MYSIRTVQSMELTRYGDARALRRYSYDPLTGTSVTYVIVGDGRYHKRRVKEALNWKRMHLDSDSPSIRYKYYVPLRSLAPLGAGIGSGTVTRLLVSMSSFACIGGACSNASL